MAEKHRPVMRIQLLEAIGGIGEAGDIHDVYVDEYDQVSDERLYRARNDGSGPAQNHRVLGTPTRPRKIRSPIVQEE